MDSAERTLKTLPSTTNLLTSIYQIALTRIEDGSQWLAYVRLRGIARKQL